MYSLGFWTFFVLFLCLAHVLRAQRHGKDHVDMQSGEATPNVRRRTQGDNNQKNRTTTPYCKSGHWVEGKDNVNIHFAGVTKSFPEFKGEEDLHFQACPVETFMHNCFFHNITERAERLLRRKWEFDDKNCKEFSPHGFLNFITNRKIYFVGDSLMHQIWSQLVCHLYTSIPIRSEVNWLHYKGGTNDIKHHIYNNITCPYGRKEHCHYIQGSNTARATIDTINSTLYFGWFELYDKGHLDRICQEFQMGPNDIIIFNFGVHYNNVGRLTKSHYEEHLQTFADDAKSNNQKTRLFFIESLPQHFTRVNKELANGYFFGPEAATWCDPIGSDELAASRDWRNRLAEQYLSNVVPIIQVATALYSQYDAHLSGDSSLVHFDPGDCTHYCAPSGIFQYIFTMIYNAIL